MENVLEDPRYMIGESDENDFEKRERAKKFYGELLRKALSEIEALGNETVMVCGPLRGQAGDNMHSNLGILQEKIREISKAYTVFDQTGYRESELTDPPHEIEMKMDIFYRGILTSGKISRIYVLPGWETSSGTQREVGYAKESGVEIEYLSPMGDDRISQ